MAPFKPVRGGIRLRESCPTVFKCYCLALYYAPSILTQTFFEATAEEHYSVSPVQVCGPMLCVLFCAVAGFLPSFIFFQRAGEPCFPFIFSFLHGWVMYSAFLAKMVSVNASTVVLTSFVFAEHLLWAVFRGLDKGRHRTIVGGRFLHVVSEFLVLLLPLGILSIGEHARAHPKDLVFIVFTPEILGLGFDVVNSAIVSGMGAFF